MEQFNDKVLKFLNTVSEYIFNDTIVNTTASVPYIKLPYDVDKHTTKNDKLDVKALTIIYPIYVTKGFELYCKDVYGLTGEEIEYVWSLYRDKVISKVYSGKIINENVKLKNYLNTILSLLVDDTIIESYSDRRYKWISIGVPFSEDTFSRIRFFDSYDFVKYCKDVYGLTERECDDLWIDYIYEINQILINEWGIMDPVYG
jgi:hypothetical protein